MSNMQGIKDHFEQEASMYDDIIIKLVPYYRQMVTALTDSLTFNPTQPIDILDLGCGTGTIAYAVKQRFPSARLTCVDIAQNMLEMAKIKLGAYADTRYVHSDFYTIEFDKKYDAIVSSLALHHLVIDEDKQQFYQKIF